jgi:hypothetical protein
MLGVFSTVRQFEKWFSVAAAEINAVQRDGNESSNAAKGIFARLDELHKG